MTREPNRSVADGGVIFEDPPAGIVVVAAERWVVELDVVSEDIVGMAAWNVCRSGVGHKADEEGENVDDDRLKKLM
jgi:hypothetical protein